MQHELIGQEKSACSIRKKFILKVNEKDYHLTYIMGMYGSIKCLVEELQYIKFDRLLGQWDFSIIWPSKTFFLKELDELEENIHMAKIFANYIEDNLLEFGVCENANLNS